MPGNYNALGGFGMNPYDPRRDPRDATDDGRPVLATGGSSSGIGTAANFWAANVGTETSGSILSPSNQNMLVGIKPTVGRISRYGVIPITADQDTPGPMAKHGHRRRDHAGRDGRRVARSERSGDEDAARRRRTATTRRSSNADGLKGARIGIPRAFFYDKVTLAGRQGSHAAGSTTTQRKAMTEAIDGAEAAGRHHRRSGRHPERRRHRSEEQLPASGARARARMARRARTRTARSSSSTA